MQAGRPTGADLHPPSRLLHIDAQSRVASMLGVDPKYTLDGCWSSRFISSSMC